MAKSVFFDPPRFAPSADPVPDHLFSLLSFCKKALTAVEEKRVRHVGAVADHSVNVKLIAATQAELSCHDAAAASPALGIAERYAPTGGDTWHIRGKFGEFLGYFWEALVL
jgi:Sigma-54 interaction domain